MKELTPTMKALSATVIPLALARNPATSIGSRAAVWGHAVSDHRYTVRRCILGTSPPAPPDPRARAATAHSSSQGLPSRVSAVPDANPCCSGAPRGDLNPAPSGTSGVADACGIPEMCHPREVRTGQNGLHGQYMRHLCDTSCGVRSCPMK